MSEVGDAISEVRAELATDASEFMADLCDLISSTSAPDGFGGTTETNSTVATNVPCSYESSLPRTVVLESGSPMTLNHRIKMPATAATLAIKPHYQIVVKVNGNVPQRTFENPTPVFGSLSPFVEVEAALQV